MSAKKGDTFEGPITVIKSGKGFFTYAPDEEDLFIPSEGLGGAFHGDVVQIEVTGESVDQRTKEKRLSGKVIDIVTRTRETFVGTLTENKEEGLVMLSPDWKKMYVPFVAKPGKVTDLPIGYKVVLRFKGWAAAQPYPWGEVEEVIGKAGVHETEMRALALSQGFSGSRAKGQPAPRLDPNHAPSHALVPRASRAPQDTRARLFNAASSGES